MEFGRCEGSIYPYSMGIASSPALAKLSCGLFLNLLMGFISANVQAEPAFPELSHAQIAGQMMMVGIGGTALTREATAHLRDIHPGSVILFHRNIQNGAHLRQLTDSLQDLATQDANAKMLIAADQEGGRVVRLQTIPSMPSALAVGQTGDWTLARDLSYQTGKALRAQGINMNLAPVLDTLKGPEAHSFIGERSFGWKPDLVAKLGSAFAEGLLRSGVVPTSKHFPGAGASSQDPHAQAVISSDKQPPQLEPFADFASLQPSAVMLSHEVYPALDSSRSPATLSSVIVTGLLRTKLGFDGVVLTDDLQMGALRGSGQLGDLAVKAIKAGVDVVMVSWGPREQRQVHDRLVHALDSGEISAEEAKAHLQRIFRLKRFVSGTSVATFPNRTPAAHEPQMRSLAQVEKDILAKNLQTGLAGMATISPKATIGLISDHSDFGWGFERTWKGTVRVYSWKQLSELPPEQIPTLDYWIAETENARTAAELHALPKTMREKILVVNSGAPGWVHPKIFRTVIQLYHHHHEVGRQLATSLSPAASASPD